MAVKAAVFRASAASLKLAAVCRFVFRGSDMYMDIDTEMAMVAPGVSSDVNIVHAPSRFRATGEAR